MEATLLESVMATRKPKTVSVKVEEDVIESARIVAALTDQSITDLMGSILRPTLAKMEREAMAKRMKRGKPEAEGGK